MIPRNNAGLPPKFPVQHKAKPRSGVKATFVNSAIKNLDLNLKSQPSFTLDWKIEAAPKKLNVISNKPIPKSGLQKALLVPQEEESNQLQHVKLDAKILESEIGKAVDLSIHLNKKVVQSNPFKAQVFPMLVSLKTSDYKLPTRASIDLVCVIDTSSSMRGRKLSLVKNALTFLLRFLNGKDRLSIITFDASATTVFPLVNITDENRQNMMVEINEVKTNVGTNISLGMSKAFEVLKARKEKNLVTSIFLLSDGVDTNRGTLRRVQESLANSKLEEEITIHTFGFGELHDSKVMTGIADLRDGNFYYIDKLDTVDEAFVDCLGGLMSVIGQNISVTVKPEQSSVLSKVRIVKAYGDAGMWTKVDNASQQSYVTRMTHLLSGKQKDFMLELEIPPNKRILQPNQKQIKTASVEVIIEGLDGQKVIKKAELVTTLLNRGEALPNEEENEEVLKNVYRVKAASIMETVKLLASEERYDEARALMNKFLGELRNSGLRYDNFVKNLMTDTTKAMLNLDSEKFKTSAMHELTATVRTYIQQKSAISMKNSNQNKIQTELVEYVKTSKLMNTK